MARPLPAKARWGLGSFAWLMLVAAVATFTVGFWARRAMQPQLTPLEKVIAQNEPDDHAHGIAISNEGTFFVGSHLGLLSSSDQKRWQRVNAIAGDVESIVVSTTGHLYVAGPEIGLVTIQGTVSQSLLTGEIRAVALDSSRPGRVLAYKHGSGLLESLDHGQTWSILADFIGIELLALAIDPHDPTYLVAGGYNGFLSYSSDGCKSWTTVTGVQGSVSALTFQPANPGQLWAAINGKLRVSSDRGVSWRSATTKLGDRSVISVGIGSSNARGLVGVTSDGYLFKQDQ